MKTKPKFKTGKVEPMEGMKPKKGMPPAFMKKKGAKRGGRMSSIHIVTVDGSEIAVVLHYAIPATANVGLVPWRTIAARFFGTTSLPAGDGTAGTIAAAEAASITAGAIVEVSTTFKIGTNTPAGAALDAAFAAAQAAWLADFSARYNHYGQTR